MREIEVDQTSVGISKETGQASFSRVADNTGWCQREFTFSFISKRREGTDFVSFFLWWTEWQIGKDFLTFCLP